MTAKVRDDFLAIGGTSMTDRYTRAVLTIIAAALVVIAGKGLAPNASAQFGSCGTSANPCVITPDSTINVYVAGGRLD